MGTVLGFGGPGCSWAPFSRALLPEAPGQAGRRKCPICTQKKWRSWRSAPQSSTSVLWKWLHFPCGAPSPPAPGLEDTSWGAGLCRFLTVAATHLIPHPMLPTSSSSSSFCSCFSE